MCNQILWTLACMVIGILGFGPTAFAFYLTVDQRERIVTGINLELMERLVMQVELPAGLGCSAHSSI